MHIYVYVVGHNRFVGYSKNIDEFKKIYDGKLVVRDCRTLGKKTILKHIREHGYCMFDEIHECYFEPGETYREPGGWLTRVKMMKEPDF